MSLRTRGTVVEYDPDLGFGFIKPDDGIRRHVVVRRDAVENAGLSELQKGDRVEFTIVYDVRYVPVAKELVRSPS